MDSINKMMITSPTFSHQERIPSKYTGEGEDVSPPLHFSGVPSTAKSLVLIVDDPDAPMVTFDHWIAWNLPATLKTLPEGVHLEHQGLNHYDEVHYRGPFPPPGLPHRYFFKLYAIDTLLNIPEGSTKEDVEKAIFGHIISEAVLIGIYQR
jgi:Raf kinase inhibitor-like YbhB/YbcL family protein